MKQLTDLFDASSTNDAKPNLLFIITDQERSLEHFPPDFCKHHLPAMTRLFDSGMAFRKAFTPTCMCSPSRATLLTSTYPSIHGVFTTGSPQPPHFLPENITNLATVVQRAGYTTVEWQGKWHLGKTPLEYGFTGWSPPDAGNYLQINDTLGGGRPDNDGRFLQNVVEFLKKHEHDATPWCLVISFVNPHDVYVAQYNVETAGYSESDLCRIQVPLPNNCCENLHTKPRAHETWSWNQVHHENDMQSYINFYAHLLTVVDFQIMQVLQTLDECHLTENTVIFRMADHGELALSHGLVEKFYNVYDESMQIPLVISNPQIYTSSVVNDSLVSLLDILPTIADLVGVATEFAGQFDGSSLVSLLNQDVKGKTEEQVIHFCYDDIPAKSGAPSIIRCIRTQCYKYAVYFVEDGSDADWELYNLMEDPHENQNVAGTDAYAAIQFVLEETLQAKMNDYHTLPKLFEWPPRQTKHSRGGPPPPQIP